MSATRKAKVQEDPWMSLYKASVLLGQTRHTLLNRIIKGELEAQIIAGRTVVSRKSVEQLQGE